MNGLPSGPVTVPVMVAAEAAEASRLRVRERSVLFAKCMSPPMLRRLSRSLGAALKRLAVGILKKTIAKAAREANAPDIPTKWLSAEPFHHAGQMSSAASLNPGYWVGPPTRLTAAAPKVFATFAADVAIARVALDPAQRRRAAGRR